MGTKTKQDSVIATFNGQEETISYQPHEQVQAVVERSMNAFGIQSNRHLMSLFNAAGEELPDHVSMKDAAVKPGDLLILRQSLVKGG